MAKETIVSKFTLKGREILSSYANFTLEGEMTAKVDVQITTSGGGITGQSGAICQGMARALVRMFSEAAAKDAQGAEGAAGGMVKKLRDSGYLTRDGRMKERKKYGRKGARRSFQFSKR